MNFTPNYKEYSLKELYIAKNNVSKELYPKKVEEIELAIFNKENGVIEEEITEVIGESDSINQDSVLKGIKMKKQIIRLSPHQNGKVFGILMAISTLPMFLPFMLMAAFSSPEIGSEAGFGGFSAVMLIIMPIFYFVAFYISVVIMCFMYNFLQKFIGGFEYETD